MRRSVLVLGLAALASAGPTFAAPCAGFGDVDDSSQFCVNVEWLKSRNITLGCSLSSGGGSLPRYCPNDPVSRLAMAAFLNRLGNVVLPPNVIWVAAVGGQFQSLQTAIDAASIGASESQRRLIKLAPGEYPGPIQMANFVDVEGSGATASIITADCSAPAVTLAMRARLREVTVKAVANGPGQCVGVKLTTVASLEPLQPSLRNVAIDVSGGAAASEPSSIGLNVFATASTDLEFQNVTLQVSGGGDTIGLLVDTFPDPAPSTTMWFRDGRIWTSFGGIGSSTGVAAARANVKLERVDVRAGGLAGPSTVLNATRQSTIGVRDSFLGALGGTMAADADSAINIINTELFALSPPWPRVSCYNAYAGTTPIAC